MQKLILFLALSVFTAYCGLAQTLTQTVKGRVFDGQSKSPLAGATVVIDGTQPFLGSVTDAEGNFRIQNVPLGRQTLQCSFLGYRDQTIPNVILTAGRETVQDVDLTEVISTLQEVSVSGFADKSNLDRQYAPVSSRTFNAEETRRFAGSRNDPSRMAANYAGVVSANDARNDIVIRGNSPAGLLWRLEGIDIPNPNHFGSMGSTGGPVSMINNNVLDRSAFLTGAFPAIYGNALSGVFDLSFRNGNADKHEYIGQIGFNGFELGAEGPFKEGAKASYLVNYRYSAPALLQGLGFRFGTGAAIPYYQDATFKIDVPTAKAGRFTVFGLGGISHINFIGDLKDTTNFYNDPYQNLYSETRTGVIGASHTYFWNRTTYTKLIVAGSVIHTGVKQDSLSDARVAFAQFRDQSWQTKLTAHLILNKKIDVRNTFVLGILANQLNANLTDSTLTTGRMIPTRDYRGHTQLYQTYAHWQHRFSDQLTFNAGLYTQTLALNGSLSVEPRLNVRYTMNAANAISIGIGRHSQMQPLSVYVTQNESTQTKTNRNLGFTYSNQAVLGYEHRFSREWQLKLEAYYQQLTNVPVEKTASSFSMLNVGASFGITDKTNLVNAGTGRNYGLELTAERTFMKGYYVLATASLFDSRYKGSDGIDRNTAFNSQYVANGLMGKEFRLGERRVIAIDIRSTWAGGKPYTSINWTASREQHAEVDDDSRAFSERAKAYFRADLKLTYRLNTRRIMQEWFLDLQNVFNVKNMYALQYDAQRNVLRTINQMGFFPNVNYRIQF